MNNWLSLNGTDIESNFKMDCSKHQVTLTMLRGSSDSDWVRRVSNSGEDLNGKAWYQGRSYTLTDGVIARMGAMRVGQSTQGVTMEFTTIEYED